MDRILIIREYRLAADMTQAQLAERVGVQYQSVSKWETGVSMPDVMLLPKIADALGVTIDDLFGRHQRRCGGMMTEDDKDFLIQTYAMYLLGISIWNTGLRISLSAISKCRKE